MDKEDIGSGLEVLKDRIDELVQFYRQDLDFRLMIYEQWNAKDILGHLAFWHESFARNLKDVATGVRPNPLKGKLSEVNRVSVESTSDCSIDELIERLKSAQGTIERYITDTSVELIPYKKGSRDYSREEHVEVVAAHIRRHLKDLKKGMKNHAKTKN